jgi:hypothetical protein
MIDPNGLTRDALVNSAIMSTRSSCIERDAVDLLADMTVIEQAYRGDATTLPSHDDDAPTSDP